MAEQALDVPVRHRTLLFAAKAGVTGVAIWWVAQSVEIDRTLSLLSSLSAPPLLAALLVLLVQAAAGAMRWREIVLLQGGKIGVVRALQLNLLGVFFNQTLSSTGGSEAVRVWRQKAAGVGVGRAVGGVVLERLAGLVALGAFAAAALPLTEGPVFAALALLAAVAVCVAAAIGLGGWFGAPTSPLRQALQDARTVLLSPGGVAVLVFSVGMHLCGAFALWLVAVSVGHDVPLVPCLVLLPPAMLIATLPISLGGWGVREAVLVAAFGIVGVPAEAALAVSIAFGLLAMASGVTGLAVWFLGRGDG